MNQKYSYIKQSTTRYMFTSKGNRAVQKVVDFTPINKRKNLYNLGFGDLLPDGRIDDKANQ